MFSFGFSGDDIEDDVDAGLTDTTTHTDDNEKNNNTSSADNLPGVFPAEKHPIEEWASFLSLPSFFPLSFLEVYIL
jgi:hypothetical protein